MASTASPASRLPAFIDSTRMRLFLGTLLYLAQGFPQGIVYYAIPTWFAATGQSTAVVGAAAAAASLPWSLKFLAGLMVDRYTWLPMGRRRPWLVGAQAAIMLVLLWSVLFPPAPEQSSLIIGFTFVVSALTAVQDVSLDALAADLTPDDEKGRLNGFMFAGKLVGIAGGMGLTGYMIEYHGFSAAMLVMLVCFAIPAATVVLVRERPGEKLLPWTAGHRSPESEDVRAERWSAVFKGVWGNIANPTSLTVIAIIVTYGLHQVLQEQSTNLYAIRQLGWSQTQASSFSSVTNIVAAVFCLTLGGWLIDRIGPGRITLVSSLLFAGILAIAAVDQDLIANSTAYIAWMLAGLFPSMLSYLSTLVLAMRVAESRVAATALAIMFGTQALGTTVGGTLLAPIEGLGGYPALFGAAALMIAISGSCALALSRTAGGAVGSSEIKASGVHGEVIDLDGLT